MVTTIMEEEEQTRGQGSGVRGLLGSPMVTRSRCESARARCQTRSRCESDKDRESSSVSSG